MINQKNKYGNPPGVKLSPELIDEYLNKMEETGCVSATLESYRRSLERLYQFLDEEKCIQAGTLEAWQTHLLDAGYSAATVNVSTSAVNRLMLYLGHRELQVDRLKEEKDIQPELTRAEYLRLLSAARTQEKEKAYLLVKLLGTTGLTVGEVGKVTAENVRRGKIPLHSGTLPISDGLREELACFMKKEGISSSPVFVTRDGKPMGRTTITHMIKVLCRDARVSEEKANPRCLRKLYQTTMDGIYENISILVEQAYNRILEKEQEVVGWGKVS